MSAAQTDWIPVGFVGEGWKERLLMGKRGPLGNVANAIAALRYAPEWQDVLHFNESSLAVIAKTQPPFEHTPSLPFTWSDEHDIQTAAWMEHQSIPVHMNIASQAVQTVARQHSYHPIRDYLDSLKWDGIKRIDDWLTLYIGVEPTDYAQAVGAKFLIGGVARIYRPGCKNDACLIMEGPQGGLKSTALRTLADPWFTDDMPELGTKDAALQTRGVWLIEIAELDSMTRADVSRVKAFMSRAVDRFRPPYGRRAIEVPRECIFAGTTNKHDYLKDETGNRRFWPVECGLINLDDLRRDRDQLWAEARDRFRAGAKWWLDSRELVEAAASEQQERYDADPWQPIIETWINGREDVTVEQVLDECLDKPRKDWAPNDKTRIGRSLKALKWERYQKRLDDGKREWRYRKSPVSPRSEESR